MSGSVEGIIYRLSVEDVFGIQIHLPRPAANGPFLLFEKLSEARMLTTFYHDKNDHRWVTFISLKTINALAGGEKSQVG